MEKQVKYFYYGMTRNSQKPLDPRHTINSISTIDTELPLIYRYSGLVFYVTDEDKLYLFLGDLTNYISLTTFFSDGSVHGIQTSDYSTLTPFLNQTNPTIGKLITVFPLGVTFIFGGLNWSYHSGTYNVENDIQYDSIPNYLKKPGKLMIYPGNHRYIINNDLSKSTELIVLSSQPVSFDNNRYYEISGILHYSIANKLYRIGEQFLKNEIPLLPIGETTIIHNLESSYLCVYLRINITNQLLTCNKFEPIDFDIIDNNTIKINSEFELENVEIIITTK